MESNLARYRHCGEKLDTASVVLCVERYTYSALLGTGILSFFRPGPSRPF